MKFYRSVVLQIVKHSVYKEIGCAEAPSAAVRSHLIRAFQQHLPV
jgi:hypothetical protein